MCPKCESYDEIEKKGILADAIQYWYERTRKYRNRNAFWQCSSCKYGPHGESDCTAINDFSRPKFETVETPDGEWASETRCRLFKEKVVVTERVNPEFEVCRYCLKATIMPPEGFVRCSCGAIFGTVVVANCPEDKTT
jgi:hypothetical protein